MLAPCHWVQCLQPPQPPASTRLKVTHWFGDPIAFGAEVMFVCERGHHFVGNYSMTHVNYTCQDGSQEGMEDLRGFFNVPSSEAEWPRCEVAPSCADPPAVPVEGVRDILHVSIPPPILTQCSINGDTIHLSCDTYSSVFVKAVTYGRNATTGVKLCDGKKQSDSFSTSESCYSSTVNNDLMNTLRQYCNGVFECDLDVPTLPLSAACEGRKRELRAEYHCGRFSVF